MEIDGCKDCSPPELTCLSCLNDAVLKEQDVRISEGMAVMAGATTKMIHALVINGYDAQGVVDGLLQYLRLFIDDHAEVVMEFMKDTRPLEPM